MTQTLGRLPYTRRTHARTHAANKIQETAVTLRKVLPGGGWPNPQGESRSSRQQLPSRLPFGWGSRPARHQPHGVHPSSKQNSQPPENNQNITTQLQCGWRNTCRRSPTAGAGASPSTRTKNYQTTAGNAPTNSRGLQAANTAFEKALSVPRHWVSA